MTDEILRAIILPSATVELLLPQSAIAEILVDLPLVPSYDGVTEGSVVWQDQQIPILLWENIESIAVAKDILPLRIAIFNNVNLFGLLFYGTPILVKLAEKDVKLLQANCGNTGYSIAKYQKNEFVIPDLQKIGESTKISCE